MLAYMSLAAADATTLATHIYFIYFTRFSNRETMLFTNYSVIKYIITLSRFITE